MVIVMVPEMLVTTVLGAPIQSNTIPIMMVWGRHATTVPRYTTLVNKIRIEMVRAMLATTV